MKTPRFILAGSLLAACLSLLTPLRLLAEPPKVETIIDFTFVQAERTGKVTKNYEYTFESWEKHVTDMPGRGALVQAKSGKGGLGESKTMISFDKVPVAALIFVVGTANNAKSLNFSLTDRDGTEQQWSIPLEGLSKGDVHTFPLDLTKCTTEVKPGKVPGMNLKKLSEWQIKGDYSEPNVEVLLIKLVAPKVP